MIRFERDPAHPSLPLVQTPPPPPLLPLSLTNSKSGNSTCDAVSLHNVLTTPSISQPAEVCSQHQSEVPPRHLRTGWAERTTGVLRLRKVSPVLSVLGSQCDLDKIRSHFSSPNTSRKYSLILSYFLLDERNFLARLANLDCNIFCVMHERKRSLK